MSSEPPPPIPSDRSSPDPPSRSENPGSDAGAAPDARGDGGEKRNDGGSKRPEDKAKNGTVVVPTRSGRPARACTIRAASRLQAAQQQQQGPAERRPKAAKKEERDGCEDESPTQCAISRIVTPLVAAPEAAQLPRWSLRSMWELASILNFLHVFRPLLNISVEFSAEEFETALLTPNDTLGDIHMPLLKAIPPITRMALTRDTWVTVLCRKLRDWWHWVANGSYPLSRPMGLRLDFINLDPGSVW